MGVFERLQRLERQADDAHPARDMAAARARVVDRVEAIAERLGIQATDQEVGEIREELEAFRRQKRASSEPGKQA